MPAFDNKELLDLMRDQQGKMREFEKVEAKERPQRLRKNLAKAIQDALDAQKRGDSDAVRKHQQEVKYCRNELKKYKKED